MAEDRYAGDSKPGAGPREPSGFNIPYAAAGIMLPLLLTILGFSVNDHGSIERLNDRVEEMKLRLIDGAVVTRLIDHDATSAERSKVVDDRLKGLETFAGASSQDRALLHYQMEALKDYLRSTGKLPPGMPLGPPDQPPDMGHR